MSGKSSADDLSTEQREALVNFLRERIEEDLNITITALEIFDRDLFSDDSIIEIKLVAKPKVRTARGKQLLRLINIASSALREHGVENTPFVNARLMETS